MNDDTSFSVALVTGAGQGIGRGVTRRLLEGYGRVYGLDHDDAALEDLSARLTDECRRRFVPLVADVGNEPDIERYIQRIGDAHGHLDLLVNNAGISDPFNGPIEQLALADWERVIRTNLTGYFLLAKHAAPLLRVARGAIVNMSSTRMMQSEPQCEAYAASKGGISALTHALALSLGPEVRVNAIAPGWVDVRDEQAGLDATDIAALRDVDHAQHPVGRVGRSRDIADAVLFLAGDGASFITGHTLVVDGGMTRKMIYRHN